MNKLFITLFLSFSNLIFSQASESMESENPRCFRKFGLGIQLAGPTGAFSIYSNWFVTNNVNIETGIGMLGYYGGIKYYTGKKDKKQLLSRYVGLELGQFGLNFDIQKRIVVYAPFGLQWMNKKGYNFSVELAIVTQRKIPTFEHYRTIPFGALKIGKNF